MNLKQESKKSFYPTLKTHLLIILFFIILTIIMTFPVIVTFDENFAGRGGDTWAYIWNFWLTITSLEQEQDIFKTGHVFYPDEISVFPLSPLNNFFAFILLQFFNYVVTWNIIWFSGFIFGGYGCFVLAYHFNSKIFPSLIAGIIFTFSSYHTAHAIGHIDLSTLIWIPIFVLFLFKISKSTSKIYPILGGIALSFVALTSWYSFFMVAIFSIIFLIVWFFQTKQIPIKKFLFNYLVMFLIGIIIIFPIIYPILLSSSAENSFDRPISEYYDNSIDLANLLIPSDFHSSTQFFQPATSIGNIEQVSYLGITVLSLSLITVIWYRNKIVYFWILIASIFALLSLGPELKILGYLTGISLPGGFFYETIPGWNFFRAPGRFVMMVSLSTAILASYSISKIQEKFFSSNKKLIIFMIVILFLILVELAPIPYPTTNLSVPIIYDTIKNDPRDIVILETPIGGSGEITLLSDPKFLFYQTYHEKPMYGGYYARIPVDIQRHLQTYFLNYFVWYDEKSDIVKQDLDKVGTSIFNHYDIGYVIIHKNTEWSWIQKFISNQFIPDTQKLMDTILGADSSFYEDSKVLVYTIPDSTSTFPFILLNSGWAPLQYDNGIPWRTIGTHAEIVIVNPKDVTQTVELIINLSPIESSRSLTVYHEANKVSEILITPVPTSLSFDLDLIPGKNIILLDADSFVMQPRLTNYEKEYEASFVVHSVKLT